MGQRWAKRLPGLLRDQNKTEVRSSSKPRCIKSSEAFMAGIFQSDFPEIAEDNHLLRFMMNAKSLILRLKKMKRPLLSNMSSYPAHTLKQ